MKTAKNLLVRLVRDEEGAAMIEYALLAGLIAVVSIVALTGLGTTIAGKWGEITSAL